MIFVPLVVNLVGVCSGVDWWTFVNEGVVLGVSLNVSSCSTTYQSSATKADNKTNPNGALLSPRVAIKTTIAATPITKASGHLNCLLPKNCKILIVLTLLLE